ncbi:hypothetical protein SAMD00019534_007560 [Acytostelium subglobosum LB1]|uniref:hypothetical protein n=1 Tax=Acytostelium subglobosum LB1 TaxID=1410327 RepID=UPI00064513A7|nr:hypothetical protein SAMD00019534_007560 [Acytostelium subglobosum LB1]GAM17581.1 hypothetical protein SAMD00019534_007560 [Acytostelium subglobosum LB1]|eukprot:XP_012759643.1 hypothetical protein SAMD00019534_007560 [Acytostelium subglobosum LB1]
MELLTNWYNTQNNEFTKKSDQFLQTTLNVSIHQQQQQQHEVLLTDQPTQKIPIPADYFLAPLSLKMFVSHFGRNSLTLFKLIMLEKGVIVFSSQPINAVCETITAVTSLFPHSYDYFVNHNPAVNKSFVIDWQQQHNKQHQQHLHSTNDIKDYALPLNLFSSKYIVHPYLSLHQMSILSPANPPPTTAPVSPRELSGSGGRIINNYKGFFVGTSNNLFLKTPPQTTHAIVDIQSSEIIYRDESLNRVMELQSSDRRFIDNIINTINDPQQQTNQYIGSDQWIRDQFELYLLCLLSNLANLIKIEDGRSVITHLDSMQAYNEWWIRSWIGTRSFNHWRTQLFKINPTPASPSNYPIHPSGPPSDILDNIQDKLQSSMKDLQPLTTNISKALFGASSFLFNSLAGTSVDDGAQQQTVDSTTVSEGNWAKVQENASKATNAMKPYVSSGKALAKKWSWSLLEMVAPETPNSEGSSLVDSSGITSVNSDNNNNNKGHINFQALQDQPTNMTNSPSTTIIGLTTSEPGASQSTSLFEFLEEVDTDDIYEL